MDEGVWWEAIHGVAKSIGSDITKQLTQAQIH